MTNLEATDSQAPVVNPMDGAGLAQTKWQENLYQIQQGDNGKIVKVADVQQVQAPSDGQQGQSGDGQEAPQKNPVKAIQDIDPKELPPSMQTIQGLAAHFDKTDDKTKALGEVKGAVEKAIQAADAEKAAGAKDFEAAKKLYMPQIQAIETGLKADSAAVGAIMQKVPEDSRKHVAGELNLLADEKTSPAVKKAIETELSSYPGLIPAADKFIDDQKAALPTMTKAQEAKDNFEKVSDGPAISRLVYADMLMQGGDKAGAQKAEAESMAIQMGMTPEQFQKLQEQQKQLQQKKP